MPDTGGIIRIGMIRVMRCDKCGKQTEQTLIHSYWVSGILYKEFNCSVCSKLNVVEEHRSKGRLPSVVHDIPLDVEVSK